MYVRNAAWHDVKVQTPLTVGSSKVRVLCSFKIAGPVSLSGLAVEEEEVLSLLHPSMPGASSQLTVSA